MAADIQGTITPNLQAICTESTCAAVGPIKDQVDRLEAKVDGMGDKVEAMGDTVEDLAKKMGDVLQSMENLSARVTAGVPGTGFSNIGPGPADTRTHFGPGFTGGAGVPSVTTPQFFRTPDPTILFCNTADRKEVDRTKFHDAIVALAGQANINSDMFDLVGDALDNRFEIRFLGGGATAVSRTHQFFQSLQLGRGKWKTQNVKDPLGQDVRFFIQPDKNPAQIRREVLAKGVKEAIQNVLPNKALYVQKSTGSVKVDRKTLCHVVVHSETSARLAWFIPLREQLGIDVAAIEEQFNVLGGGPSLS